MKMFKVLNKFTQVLAISFILVGTAAQASHDFVQADISGGTKKVIAPIINASLQNAKAELRKNRKADTHYFLDRNDPDTYHVTLDSIVRKDGKKLSDADHPAIVNLVSKFQAKSAQTNNKGGKSYAGEGFELRLYVHYVDGTIQHYAMNPSKKVKDIRALKDCATAISYCNLVIKHGTKGALKADWEEFRKKCLNQNGTYTTKGEFPKLDTHMTLANIYKYTDDAFAKKKAGQKAAFTPFNTNADKDVLINSFVAACSQFKRLDPMNINRITVRGAAGSQQVWLGKKK